MRRLLDRLRLRLRSLVSGGRLDAALRREIEHHLDALTAEHVAAGMSPADARAAALRAFGPVSSIEETCRDHRRVAVFANLVQDLRYTLRSLVRQPMLLAAAILSIAIAVSANATIFNLANEMVLAYPTAVRPDRLGNIQLSYGSHVSYGTWKALEGSGALDGLAGYNIESEITWRDADATVSLIPIVVTANFFDVTGIRAAMGRTFTAAEAAAERAPSVVVVSYRFWERRLRSDPSVLGRTLIFNGQPYAVVGVLPAALRSMAGFAVAPEVYLPLSRSVMPDLDQPMAATVQLLGRLREGQSFADGRAALDVAAQQLPPQGNGRRLATVGRFSPIGGVPQIRQADALSLFFVVLLVAVALVLAIACANVAGLLLARSTARSREIAIRAALGASRWRLAQQLLTEGLWIALLGTAVGLPMMVLWTKLLGSIPLPLPLPLELRATFDLHVLGYSVGLLVLTTVLCGLMPAIHASRTSLLPGLKLEEQQYGHRRWTLRNLLVIGQLAVAVILLVTAALFTRNLVRSRDADPGFETWSTIVARLGFVEGHYTDETRDAFLARAVETLEAIPTVERATYARGVPLTLRSGATTGVDMRIEGHGDPFNVIYQSNSVGPGYFSTMGIAVRRGREFLPSDRAGAPAVAIVNEEFVRRYIHDLDPIGLRLLLPGAGESYPAEIVGVVADSKHRTIGETQQAAIYESFPQRVRGGRVVHALVRTREPNAAAVRDVQRALLQLDPTASAEVEPMRRALAFAFLPSQVGALLLGALGVLGLALAIGGLFAVVSYAVSRRTVEIGIRIAMGATPGAVMRLVLFDATILTIVGIAAGSIVAMFVTTPLSAFLVAGLDPHDPNTFVGTALLLAAVSLAGAWLPARRALRIDPVLALRNQ
jgi:predicted permease